MEDQNNRNLTLFETLKPLLWERSAVYLNACNDLFRKSIATGAIFIYKTSNLVIFNLYKSVRIYLSLFCAIGNSVRQFHGLYLGLEKIIVCICRTVKQFFELPGIHVIHLKTVFHKIIPTLLTIHFKYSIIIS